MTNSVIMRNCSAAEMSWPISLVLQMLGNMTPTDFTSRDGGVQHFITDQKKNTQAKLIKGNLDCWGNWELG